MDPVLERKIIHPPVAGATVVGHDVHYHFQTLLVGFGDIFPVLGIAAETWVDAVVVATGIAVVRPLGLVVHQKRSTPDGGGTKVGDVVQVIDNALKITTMAAKRLAAVSLLGGVIGVVISLVGVGETVGADQIDKIRSCETATLGGTFLPRGDPVRIAEGTAILREYDAVLTGLGRCAYGHVNKKIVRAVRLMDLLDADTFTLDPDIIAGDAIAVDHQLERGLHAHPPARRLHVRNP